jgi:hypothetical protein
MRIASTKSKKTYAFGKMDATGRYFEVDFDTLKGVVNTWIETDEVASKVKSLAASYIEVADLGRYCVLSKLEVPDEDAETHFANYRNKKSWLGKRAQDKLCDLLAEALDRELPNEFFRIESTKAASTAAVPTADIKVSASTFSSVDLQPVSSAFLAALGVPSIAQPANPLEQYMAAAYQSLAKHLICRPGTTDDELRSALVVTFPLIMRASATSSQLTKQYLAKCVWIPSKIAMVYQPAKPSTEILMFGPDGTPIPHVIKTTKPQTYHFMNGSGTPLAFLLTLPEPGQGLGQSRSDSITEMSFRWIGPRSLGYALGFDMYEHLYSEADIGLEPTYTSEKAEKGDAQESWFAPFLPGSATTIVTKSGAASRLPRTPPARWMDSEIRYYKKANLALQSKKNYPKDTLPFERDAASRTPLRPMLVSEPFSWFKSQRLLAIKTKKQKHLIPNYNPNPRKDAADAMLGHMQKLVGGTILARMFGNNFKGSATEVTEAVFRLLVTPFIKDDATTVAAGKANTATPMAVTDTAAATPAKAATATAPATTPAATYWRLRSKNLRRMNGTAANANVIGLLRTDQEWCHLLGHGDKGEEKPENFVAGSKHCNTEQLAIEEGHRITRGTLEVRITAYLLPQASYWLKSPFEEKTAQPWIDYLKKGMNDFAVAKALLNTGPNKEPTVLKSFELANYFDPARYKALSAAVQATATEGLSKTTGWEKLRALQNLLEAVDADIYVHFPVAAFIRYKIYLQDGTKLFDHVFDAQKESFDYNEFQIVRTTVRRVVSVAFRGSAAATQHTGSAAPSSKATATETIDYEEEVNQAICARMKREIIDLIEKDPTLSADQVTAIFRCDGAAIKNYKGSSGRVAVMTLGKLSARGYSIVNKQFRAVTTKITIVRTNKTATSPVDLERMLAEKHFWGTLKAKLWDLSRIEPYALPAEAAATSAASPTKSKGKAIAAASGGTTAASAIDGSLASLL